MIKKLAKNTFIYGLGNLLNRTINLLLLPIFTAYLTPKDYGILSMLNFVLLLLSPILAAGVGTSFGQCYKEEASFHHKSCTVWSCFILLLITSSFSCILGISFAEKISIFLYHSDIYYRLVQLTFISLFFSIMQVPFTLFVQFEERATTYIFLTILTSIITIASNCTFVILYNFGVFGIVLGILLSNIIQFSLFFFVTWKETFWIIDRKMIRSLLVLGTPMILSFFFLFVVQNSWRYFLDIYTSLEDLGIFSIGYNYGTIGLLFVSSFVPSWAPYFLNFSKQQEEAKKVFSKIHTFFYYGVGTFSLFVFFFAKFIVQATTQPNFYTCYDVIGFIALGYFLSGGYYLYLPGVYYAKKVYLSIIPQAISAITILLLSILLTSSWGKWGVVIAFLSANLLMTTSQLWLNYSFKLFYAPHDWKRLLSYLPLFTLFIVLSFIPRTFSLLQEGLFSFGLSFSYLCCLFILLNEHEKAWLYDKWFKLLNFLRVKAPGLNDRKSLHISNIR